MKTRITLDELSIFFIFAAILAQGLLPNGSYLFLSYALVFLLFSQVSQPYKPAVFSIIIIHHLLQIVGGVWLANYLEQDINYRSVYAYKAILLSLAGMVFLFAPIIYQQNKLKKLSLSQFKAYSLKLSTQKSLYCYIAALFITSALAGVAFIYTGITQILISLVKVKWFFFLLFGYQAVLKKEKLTIFYILIGFEFLSGFYSFFSDFKTVIYYLGVLLLSFVVKINFRQLMLVTLLGVGLAFMGILWTSIKTSYRTFLNNGSKSQTVNVSKDEAVEKLLSLSSEVNQGKTASATTDLLDRLQYTYHFAKTLERVPDIIPYQNGANWLNNIEYSTTPRFLNPNKPTIDNSLKATKYTGIQYATARQGTSFSLGYFAEFYVDFGSFLMMPMLCILGLVYAQIYKFFLTKASDNPVVNYSIVGAFFFEFYAFEMDGTYLTGRLFASALSFFTLNYFFLKPLVRFISNPVAHVDK